MNFFKWSGLGNDFIILPPTGSGKTDFSAIAPRWCDRHFGIGADGVVVLRELGGNVFEMRIFNSDGSEAEMCGNATRCVGLFLKRRVRPDAKEFELRTKGGVVRPKVIGTDEVRVDMGMPRFGKTEIPVDAPGDARHLDLALPDRTFTAFAVSMGNPHAVIFVADAENFPVSEFGPQLECHPAFPRKCNIEFARMIDRGHIRMRVWERGCGITLACGTGSCATAVAAITSGLADNRVEVRLDGGTLTIEYVPGGHVFMTGGATEIFQGEIQEF